MLEDTPAFYTLSVAASAEFLNHPTVDIGNMLMWVMVAGPELEWGQVLPEHYCSPLKGKTTTTSL